MNWKEIFKVSGVLAVVGFVLLILFDIIQGGDWLTEIVILIMVSTGFILNRRLKKNEDWGVVIGMVVSLLLFVILMFLIIDVLGL